jgi:chromosome segregation ATPase
MALFKGKEPAARLRADLDSKHARRADLSKQHDDEKAAAAVHTATLHEALIGSASPERVAEAENSLANAERRVRALASALAALDAQLAEGEAELANMLRKQAAQQAADQLCVDHEVFSEKLAVFMKAAAELVPAAARVGERITTAKELEGLARTIVSEVPAAERRLVDEVRWTADLIIRQAGT